MIFSRRRNSGKDPHLDWKVRLFFLGAVIALVGIGMDSTVLIGIAVGVLFGAMALRFLPEKNEDR